MRHMVQESPGEGCGAALSRKGGRGKRTDEQGKSHGGGATAKGKYDAFAQRALSHTPVLHPATWVLYPAPPRSGRAQLLLVHDLRHAAVRPRPPFHPGGTTVARSQHLD